MDEIIVLLDPVAPATAERLRALLPPGFALVHATERGEAHLQALIADADYAISGQVGVSVAVLGAARRLKLLHKWGVGVDNLDLDAARARGIAVARTTGSNAVPVGEFAVALMLAAMRNLAAGHAALQRGEWGSVGGRPATTLRGKTVGLLGFGASAQVVARAVRDGFGCAVLCHKPRPLDPAEERAHGVRWVGFDRLLADSHVLSLHCPLTRATAGLLDRAAFERMRPGAVLVNVARAAIVVEADLLWALRTGRLGAAALDVYEPEPLPADSPLLGLDNLVTTPHIAAASADTFGATVARMYANIARVSRGEPVAPGDIVA